MENRTILIKHIPSNDPRLKRHIHHDSESLNYKFDTSAIPKVVSTKHNRLIPILDQGNVGSCTGNASIGVLGTAPHSLLNNTICPLNEKGALEIYSAAEVIDGDGPYPPNDNGSSGLSVAKVMKAKKLISGYQHNFTLQDTLLALTKYPLMIGSNWHNDMFTPDADGRVHPTGPIEGGHEYEAFEVDAEKGIVWFANSWGENWGVNGNFYMTWEDLGKLLAASGDSTVPLPLTATPPAPVVAVKSLKYGQTSKAVKALQIDLQSLGYFPAAQACTGYFGLVTKKAVEDFQTADGLTVDGVAGPVTLAEIAKKKV